MRAPATAALGARLVALLVDWALIVAMQGLLAVALQAISGQPYGGAFLLAGFLSFGYRAVFHSHHFDGATVGKRLVRLCVVTEAEGLPPSLDRSALRALVRVAPVWAGTFVLLSSAQPGDFVGLASRAASAGALVVALEVATVALVLFDPNGRRALHDLLAGTRVVAARDLPAQPAPPVRGRVLVQAGLLSLAIALGWHLAFSGMASIMAEHFTPLGEARSRIEELPCVQRAQATRITTQRPMVQVVVIVEADCDAPDVTRDATRIVLDEEPDLDADTPLSVAIHRLGRAGAASWADLRQALTPTTATVEEWRKRLKRPAEPRQ